MAKMKLAPTSENIQALVRLTDKLPFLSSVTIISFFNATHSNFLNVFFMRPVKEMRSMFVIL